MFNVRLAGGHLYGKQLFTWLSLVVSLMASFGRSFFPLDVLDEILDLIQSVSEGFLTYSSIITSSKCSRERLYLVVAVCRMAPQAALLEQSLAVGNRRPAGSTERARRAWSPSVPAGTL